MSKKRVFPFGYQMREGQIMVNPQEAELVLEIFEQYRQGKTTPELAASAMLQGIPYREGFAGWNKNMVCRILDDSRYTGSEEYPPIVEQELYQAVRIRRAAGRKKEAVLPKEVREKIVCPRCGRTLCRTACRQEKVNWGCPDCGWESGWLEDSRLLWQITALLNRLIQEPALAAGAASKGDALSVDAMRLAREINRKLGDPKANDGELLQLIQQCAQEKYRVCTANGWETQSLAKHLAGQQPGETLDTALFEKIVKSVQISGGQISLQLVNGVILT